MHTVSKNSYNPCLQDQHLHRLAVPVLPRVEVLPHGLRALPQRPRQRPRRLASGTRVPGAPQPPPHQPQLGHQLPHLSVPVICDISFEYFSSKKLDPWLGLTTVNVEPIFS